MYYSGKIPPKLDPDDEQRLLQKMSEESDENARDLLIEHNLRFVIYIAEKFEDTGVSSEELVSAGTVGLVKGVRTFRPEIGVKLATYLSRCIENEIRIYLRRVKRSKGDLSIERTFLRDSCGRVYPLSDILGTDSDAVSQLPEREELSAVLEDAIHSLSLREQMIVRLRYGLDEEDGKCMTQQEIGDLLGISQSYVSRIERRILLRLRRILSEFR